MAGTWKRSKQFGNQYINIRGGKGRGLRIGEGEVISLANKNAKQTPMTHKKRVVQASKLEVDYLVCHSTGHKSANYVGVVNKKNT